MKKTLLGLGIAMGLMIVSVDSASAMMMKPNMTNGWIMAHWGEREGGCWINYTPSTAKAWQHRTVSACSNGSQKVSGLMKGKWYKFTVSRDGHNWTKVMKVKAQ